MDFFDVVRTRRSIRKFDSKPIEQAKIDRILESALRAPSARGSRPWEFVVVTDAVLLEKLAGARPSGSGFLKGAPLAIVVCADPGKSEPWVEDATIAAVTIQYAARALDLASCWTQMRLRDYNEQKTSSQYVAEILGLPSQLEVECIVGIGYAAEIKPPYAENDLLSGRISYNRFAERR